MPEGISAPEKGIIPETKYINMAIGCVSAGFQ